MNYIHHGKIIFVSRNEGKLKSYDSCFDLRAWSHDMSIRDRYLREWMKCNMPTCVFSLPILNNLLKSMTCNHFGRLAPRCHPDCKSKKLVDSICASCHTMKECLKSNENLEQYFEEEEMETGHWPCDKCLGALKSIRMFWRIIIDKIFKVQIPKTEDTSEEHIDSGDCVQDITKSWQKEILEQAAYIKKIIPSGTSNIFLWKNVKTLKNDIEISSSVASNQRKLAHTACETNNIDFTMRTSKCECTCRSTVKKSSWHVATSALKLSDAGCDPVNVSSNEENIKASPSYVQNLQGKLEIQINELKELKKENISLKSKLGEVCKKHSGRSFHGHGNFNPVGDINPMPNPFETCSEEKLLSKNSSNDDNSEVIITVRNYKNEDFKHVCMLQLVHKSNIPTVDFTEEPECCQKQDPIDLLNKVQNTFRYIVQKELSIVSKKHSDGSRQEISATFGKNPNNLIRSPISCTNVSPYWSKR